MITIKDIAERAGVSYATVSRALNNRSDVSSETRKLIMELASEMGYQPNAIARSLVKRKSMNIALIVPDVSNPFFADITMAVNSAAENAGYTTMVCNTGWDQQKEQEKLRVMVEQRVDGIILKPTGFSSRRLSKLTMFQLLFSGTPVMTTCPTSRWTMRQAAGWPSSIWWTAVTSALRISVARKLRLPTRSACWHISRRCRKMA